MNINLTDIGRELRIKDPVPVDRKLPTWKVGQVLDAVAGGRDSAGQLQLRIGGRQLLATSAQGLDVQQGARLLLEVIKTQPQPVLRLLAEPNANKSVEAALRQLFPRQQSLSDLTANLGHLRANPKLLQQLPPQVRQVLTRLMDAFPDSARLARSNGLRQAIAESGLFLESRLQQPQSASQAIQNDTKGLLARLVDTLARTVEEPATATTARPGATPQPGRLQAQGLATATLGLLKAGDNPLHELFKQAAGALARIEIHQTQASQHQNGLWLPLELPVWDGEVLDVLQVQISRDGGGGESEPGDQPMVVRIAFEFETLGPVYASVRLHGNQVSTTWWAERPDVAGLFQEHLDLLRSRLSEAGLEVGTISCAQGRPASVATDDDPATATRGILDEQA